MSGEVVELLRTQPEIALFLVLAIGHAVGAIRFGPIQLGGICGTLIAALVVGQLGIRVDDSVKNVFFMLFIFALGYAGGPQFFANLDAKGLRLGLCASSRWWRCSRWCWAPPCCCRSTRARPPG